MKPIKFVIIFIAIVVVCVLASIYLPIFANQPAYHNFHFSLIGIYSLICIVAYVLANMIVGSKNNKYFTHLIMMNVFAKMMLTAIFVLIYFQLYGKPEIFVMIPFMIIYLLFTVFESWFLIIINPKT